MSKLSWFIAGVSLGAVAAIQLRENPKAQAALEEAISAAKDFGNAVVEGYQEREAELSTPKPKPKTAK
jgi:hypothetical protein